LEKIMPDPSSISKLPRQVNFYINTQARERLFRQAKLTASARRETPTSFVVRAVEREVIRCSGGDARVLFREEHDAAAAELQRMLDAEIT
jgi:hypothetical protein